MDIRSLQHVVVLARHLSYTKAAEELGIAQPTLTRSIQSIEAQAKVRLFDRDRGGVLVTPVGKDFVRRAASILAETKDLEHLLDQVSRGQGGDVAFGMTPLAARSLLASVLSDVFATKPKLKCRVAVRSADALLSLLSSEEIEFFLCAEGLISDSLPLRRDTLGTFPLSYIVRAGHPLLAKGADLKSAKYPVLHSGFFGSSYKAPRQATNISQGLTHIIEDYDVLERLTEATDAIWFSSAFAAIDRIGQDRLKEIPFPPDDRPQRFRMIMYTLERRSLSPGAREVKSACLQAIQNLDRKLETISKSDADL